MSVTAVDRDTLAVRVAAIRQEADDIRSFELVDVRGQPLPGFTPGAHVDVYMPGNMVRQYSLCSSDSDLCRYLIAVKLEPASRGGSAHMHHSVKRDDVLTIGVPRNAFPLDPSATQSLFLAGGIGVTPIVSMVESLLRRNQSVELDMFARSPAHMPFRSFLHQPALRGRLRALEGMDAGGVRRYLETRLADQPAGMHLYVCGPGGFVEAVRGAAAHWTAGAVHVEAFGAAPAPSAAVDQAFQLRLARSGLEICVPAHSSMLQALRERGVEVEASCEQGICGTCMARVLEGVPDHRDSFLSEEERFEGERVMLCVSRARSERLVLDL